MNLQLLITSMSYVYTIFSPLLFEEHEPWSTSLAILVSAIGTWFSLEEMRDNAYIKKAYADLAYLRDVTTQEK